MENNITIRKAKYADVERILEIIRQAKEQMRRMNSRQWQEDYPAEEHITGDIEKGYGYVLCGKTGVIAFAAVIFDGEPAYDKIDGKWLTDFPYVVVHRLAVADEMKQKGIATFFMRKIEELAKQNNIRSFRVDTNFDNLYMQKILFALDFTSCGDIYYDKGKRMVYEKRIG
ncbi:MAG: GNAT family N-acetyltransferase [Dysgonamonadaceae bacterium]|jgi:N-acetylglutamate synthase-like GNAT family acetyltransferase|nr:GNAT family N-acetyltransferase [Dysgonamonadaceae bacterium]